MNPFRPAALAVALSLACTAPLSFGADAADAAAAAASDVAPVSSAPAPRASGLDRAGMDAAVRAQDSLFGAMNGTWVKDTPIPADKSAYGTFTMLDDLSNERVKAIIEGLAARPQAGGIGAKVGDYYASFMDTAAIDRTGMRALWPYLAQIDAVKTRKDLVALMGRWVPFVDLPLGLGVGPDARDPTIYSAGAAQGGLGLGDRDYYLKKDARFAKARAAYLEYMRVLLGAQGSRNARVQASAVMNLETRLATIQWTQEANRDPVRTYNPMTLRQLAAKAPDIDWPAYLAAGELADAPFVSIAQPSYVWALDKLVRSVPIDVWKAYLRVHLMDAQSLVLPADVREARFRFHGVAMNGVRSDRSRWERGVDAVNGALGEAVGQIYVSEYFPPAYKARMVELVDNLMKAYAQSIDGLTWMSPATKVEAHAKLARYAIKIGYPDHWRDYTALDVKAGDPILRSSRSVSNAATARTLASRSSAVTSSAE